MAYSQAVIQESEALWAHYFEPALGKRAANQFRRAMQRPDDAFADHFLNPHLFRPDLGGGVYVPVDITKFSDGRNHLLAETISTRTPNIGVDGDPRTGLSYFANRGDLVGQWSSYKRFRAKTPFPIVGGAVKEVEFHTAREIMRVLPSEWATVTTAWSGDYGDEEEDRFGLYADTVGRPWCIAPRGWWKRLAKRVLVLTTEALPTAVARRIGSPWLVAEFEASGLERDIVTVEARRDVRAAKLPLVVQAFQRDHPGVAVISNKVAVLDDTATHARARGSNAYIGRDVAQTMTFLSPGEYERLEALNAWCGRDDLVGVRHVDEYNQSAGRNLGFRRRGDPKHWLLISPRLLGCLLARQSLGRARYDLRVRLDRQRRWIIKH